MEISSDTNTASNLSNFSTSASAYKPKPHGQARRYDHSYHELFESVASFYCEAKERIAEYPLAATTIDPDGPRSMRVDLLVLFVADVELAIEYACRDNPAWQAACLSILREYAGFPPEQISHGMRHAVIQSCGAVLERRGLDPKKYFRIIRRKRGEQL